MNNGIETLTELQDVATCILYNHQKKVVSDDGSIAVIHEQGIQLSFYTHKNDPLKLLFFRGKEGDTLGDESIIINRWIGNIHSTLKKVTNEVRH